MIPQKWAQQSRPSCSGGHRIEMEIVVYDGSYSFSEISHNSAVADSQKLVRRSGHADIVMLALPPFTGKKLEYRIASGCVLDDGLLILPVCGFQHEPYVIFRDVPGQRQPMVEAIVGQLDRIFPVNLGPLQTVVPAASTTTRVSPSNFLNSLDRLYSATSVCLPPKGGSTISPKAL